jgi:hypothetical protein
VFNERSSVPFTDEKKNKILAEKKQALRRFTGKAHRRATEKRLNFGIA